MLGVLCGPKPLIFLTAISVWFGDEERHLLKQIIIQITHNWFHLYENFWKLVVIFLNLSTLSSYKYWPLRDHFDNPEFADLNLRFKILSEFAFAHPIPLVYPRFQASEPDFFSVNGEIMSVLEESTCILSLGFSKCQQPCGNLTDIILIRTRWM